MLLHISGVEDFNWILSFIAAIETEESVFSFAAAIMKQANSQKSLLLFQVPE